MSIVEATNENNTLALADSPFVWWADPLFRDQQNKISVHLSKPATYSDRQNKSKDTNPCVSTCCHGISRGFQQVAHISIASQLNGAQTSMTLVHICPVVCSESLLMQNGCLGWRKVGETLLDSNRMTPMFTKSTQRDIKHECSNILLFIFDKTKNQ